MSEGCPAAIDLYASVTFLVSSLRKRDSRPASKRALAHLRADPAMAEVYQKRPLVFRAVLTVILNEA
jgi:hypothetical protein